MKLEIILALLGITLVTANPRSKRQAYYLPDGAELIIGSIKTSFQCSQDGYFADIDNGCQIFHVCHTAHHADGNVEIQQWSFFCGNQTVFSQLTLTCAYPDEAIPCGNSAEFFNLNSRIGQEKELFLVDNDLQKAAPLLESARASYGRRPAAGGQGGPIQPAVRIARPGPGIG